MAFFTTLKQNGKRALTGNWSTAIAIGLILGGVQLFLSGMEYLAFRLFVLRPLAENPTMEPADFDLARFTRELFTYNWVELLIMVAFGLLAFLLLSPLRLGSVRWYYSLIQGEHPPIQELFYFFDTGSRYVRAVWLRVQLSFRSFFWGLIFFFLPGGIMGISLWFLRTPGIDRQTRSAASLGFALSFGLLFLAAILYVLFLNKYALASYLLCENDAIRVSAAIRTSIRYTRGYRATLLLFSLSFLGWFLLTPVTLFLLLLFVGPYYQASCLLLSRYLAEKNRLSEPLSTQEWHPVRSSEP